MPTGANDSHYANRYELLCVPVPCTICTGTLYSAPSPALVPSQRSAAAPGPPSAPASSARSPASSAPTPHRVDPVPMHRHPMADDPSSRHFERVHPTRVRNQARPLNIEETAIRDSSRGPCRSGWGCRGDRGRLPAKMSRTRLQCLFRTALFEHVFVMKVEARLFRTTYSFAPPPRNSFR